jgi:hypothetical protein
MRSSSGVRYAALSILLALLVTPEVFAASATQTLTFSGGEFNSTEPTLNTLSPAATNAWSAVLFVNLQWFNSSSGVTFDFLSSSKPSALTTSTSAPLAENQGGGGWYQFVRVQLYESGKVFVYYRQNSTSGSTTEIFSCTACWDSNGTALGSLTGNNHASAPDLGSEAFVAVQGGSLYVGQLSTTGGPTYWVNGFGLTSQGLAGSHGLTTLGGATAAYASTGGAGTAVPAADSGNGYAQAEIDPAGFVLGTTLTTTTNVILQVVPLIVVVAVIGLVVGMLKKFKL